MVKDRSSPDDPDLTGYWEYRRRRRALPLDIGMLTLLDGQRGRCPRCGALLFDPGHLPASPEDRENWWLGVTRQQVRRAASAAQAARPPEGSGTILALMHASCHRSARAAERRNPALHPQRPQGLLELGAWKAGKPGSEGAAARQRAPAT